ncbi:DUF1735 domain-containing protein [Parasediminibacterium paludis]|uniref:DUF1735 domain-containing protein n=1 Tax=Parasediminibacterium paludis TaxID=908966 RepID=A0ABV8PYD2_9BACT
MKKHTINLWLSVVVLVIVSFTSCVKDVNKGTIVDGLQPTVSILEGGLVNFSQLALSYPSTDPSDTFYFHANYAATNVAPKDITVTLAYDAAALASYNATSSVKYTKCPDSIYSFKATTVTIKAGQSYSSLIPMVFFPSKIDPTQNYMLPISITDAQGNNISGNFGTIYFHFIGNPIAGAYNEEWIRFNNAAGSGSPSYDRFYSNVFSANNPTEVSVQSGGNGLVFIIDFTNNGGVLSNFTATIDPASYGNAGLGSLISGPTIVADPINKIYTINFSYTNTSGAGRNVTEIFKK